MKLDFKSTEKTYQKFICKKVIMVLYNFQLNEINTISCHIMCKSYKNYLPKISGKKDNHY